MDNIDIIDNASNGDIAQWIAARLGGALVLNDGSVAIALPGGATPFPILELLVSYPLPWHRLEIWPTDDRLVAEDHPASNTGKLRALFEPLGARVCALSEQAAPPAFALVWLGMGGDGHIASLFPNTDPRATDPQFVRRLTPDPLPPEAPFDRVTLTIPALQNCDEMLFVIRGDDKRGVFMAAARGGSDLPVARLLAACDAPVSCFT
jgi:6-phosphogluconolactonase